MSQEMESKLKSVRAGKNSEVQVSHAQSAVRKSCIGVEGRPRE